jgi:hypothetical protein
MHEGTVNAKQEQKPEEDGSPHTASQTNKQTHQTDRLTD